MELIAKILCWFIPIKKARHFIKEHARGLTLIKMLPSAIFKFLDFFIPKNPKKIVFFSVPNFTDNPKAYYDYIKNNYSDKYDLIWLYHDVFFLNNDYKNKFKSYYFYTIKAMWHLLSSKYIVWTHGMLIDRYTCGTQHAIMQLWHGMPIKTIGFCEKNIPSKTLKSYTFLGKHAHFFVTSDIYKNVIANNFHAKFDNIHITGQPRTDLCFEAKEELEKHFEFQKYKKVILYTPTYKECPRGKYKDIDAKLENIFYMEDYKDEIFNDYLNKNEILFLLKPHPFDEVSYIELREKGLIPKNVKLILNLDFVANDFHLYNIFNYIDLLITDFSSIAIDYMVLNKPMIFLSNLSNQYANKRGFLFTHNLNRILLGDEVSKFDELIASIQNNLKDDKWKAKREQEVSLWHQYSDANACKRVYEIMTKL